MAIRYRQDEDEEQQQGGTQKLSGDVITTASGGLGGDSASPGQQRPNSSGQFQNLIGFLDANRTQASTMANKIGEGIDKQVKEGTETIDKTATEYTNRVQQGRTNYDQNIVNQTIANPTGDTTQIKNILGGEYKGPNSLQETDLYNPLTEKLGALQTTKTLGESSGGQDELIARAYGANPSSSKYDKFLINQTEPAWNRITSSLNSISPVFTTAEQKLGELNTLAPTAKADSKAAADQARNQLTAERDRIRDSVNAALSGRVEGDRATQNAIREAIATNNFDVLDKLNLPADQITNLKRQLQAASLFDENINESLFLNANDPAAIYNANNIASDDQVARWTALNELVAGTGNFLSKDARGTTPEATSFDHLGLGSAYADAVVQGLLEDEAKRMVGRGQYKDFGSAMEAAQKAMSDAKIQNTLSGASTGASIAGPWGAAIGAILGYAFSDGGWDDIKHSSGFTGPSMEQAFEEGNWARVGSNPAAALAYSLGGGSDLVKALDPFPSLFGGDDTKGTKDYKAYKKLPPDIPGRDFPDDFGGVEYNLLKQHRGDENLQKLASAFGVGGAFNKKGDNEAFRVKLNEFMSNEIAKAQQNGLLPSDPNALAMYSGDRVFDKIFAPALEKFSGGRFSGDTGLIGTLLRDMADRALVAPAKQAAQPTSQPTTGGGGGGGGNGRGTTRDR